MRFIRCALFALCLFVSGVCAATASYRIGHVPSWVEVGPVAIAPSRATSGQGDIRYLLRSDQFSLLGKRPEHYIRRVLRLNDASAVDTWSNLKLSFDPPYQTLQIHHVRVYRNGRWSDRLATARIRELQRGEGTDEGLIDDTRTINLVLDDIRVGDVLDLDYTRIGANPVFGGRFVYSVGTGSDAPTALRTIRLLYPASRTLHMRASGPALEHTRTVRDGRVDERWRAVHLPAFSSDRDAPDWYAPWGWLDVAEFADWADVERWAQPMYAPQPDDPAVQALVQRWKKAHPGDRAAQALAALRFVQDDIRYTGIEIGIGSHKPRAPAQVLRTRYGDCKDKAVLLSSLWRAQGLRAWPALVSSWQRGHIDENLPSPLAFDHVIVHLDWHGSRWFDATAQLQGGDLEHTVQSHLGRALVIGDGSTGLTVMPDPRPAGILVDVEETLDLRKPDGALAKTGPFVIRTTYRGREADRMRYGLTQESRKDTARRYLNYLANYFPGVQLSAPIDVDDDRASNTLHVTEHYRMADLWETSGASHARKAQFWLSVLDSYLQRPSAVHRSAPYALGPYRFVHEKLSVKLDNGWNPDTDRTDVDNAWFKLYGRFDLVRNQMTMEATYRSLQREVSAGDMSALDAGIREARGSLGYRLTIHPPAKSSPDAAGRIIRGLQVEATKNTTWVWLLAVLAATVLCAFALRRYRGSNPLLAVFWRPREAVRTMAESYGEGWNFLLLGLASFATRAMPGDKHATLVHMPWPAIMALLVIGAVLSAGVQLLLCAPLAWFARKWGAAISWQRMRRIAALAALPQMLLWPLLALYYAIFGRDGLLFTGRELTLLVAVMVCLLGLLLSAFWSITLSVRMMSEVGGVRVRRVLAILLVYTLIVGVLALLLVALGGLAH